MQHLAAECICVRGLEANDLSARFGNPMELVVDFPGSPPGWLRLMLRGLPNPLLRGTRPSYRRGF
jgi:hypothetical protein